MNSLNNFMSWLLLDQVKTSSAIVSMYVVKIVITLWVWFCTVGGVSNLNNAHHQVQSAGSLMEYHRNPSPPDSPSGQSHDITITSSADTAQPDSTSYDNTLHDSTLLVNYDDRIGDTVFSKAWVLSLLVKAVEAVKEQQNKIEISNHSEDNICKCDTEELELNIEDRQSMLSSKTVQSDVQVMGMESQECDQPDSRDRPTFSEPEQNDGLLEANSRDASAEARTKEDQREMQIGGNNDDNSMQRTEKESMICETSPAHSDREERERRGERGEDRESDGNEGDDGLFDVRDRTLSDGAAEEISESLENDLCRLWDASMNMEVAQFIHEQHGVELLLGVANRSAAPRLTEICIGLLGNMACSENICVQGLSNRSETVQMLVQFMESSDTRILYETSRLIVTCLSHEKAHPVWLKEIQQSEVMYPAMMFILQGSTNTELLQSTASLLDRLLDSSEELLMEWATRELVEAMCEAAEQVRVSCVDATCSLLMTLQLLSTVDKGVEAIVECESKVFSLLHSFLAGLDHLEGQCSPVMATVSLFIALKENSNSEQVEGKLNDSDFTQTVQRISDQAHVLSQQSGEEDSSAQYSELHILILRLL